MTPGIILEIQNVSKLFGGVSALENVSFQVTANEVQAIIGPNGAGKTTLLNVISGVNKPSAGQIRLAGRDVTGVPSYELAASGVARTFQTPQMFQNMTALENVIVGAHLFADRNLLTSVLRTPDFKRREAELFAFASELMHHVGLGHRIQAHASEMPYGELKRLEVARALAQRPKLLLLDEPAAGLNVSETAQIGAIIRALPDKGITPILIEHDMKLVMNVSDKIQVLVSGKTLASGTPEQIQREPAVLEAYLGAPDDEIVLPPTVKGD